MKTKINGHEVECSVQEFKELLSLKQTPSIPQQPRVVAKRPNKTFKHWKKGEITILKEAYQSPRNKGPGGKMKVKALDSLCRKLKRNRLSIAGKASDLGLTGRK